MKTQWVIAVIAVMGTLTLVSGSQAAPPRPLPPVKTLPPWLRTKAIADRNEQKRDVAEDRRDRAEDWRDARTFTGLGDILEDIRDRAEDVRDHREDRRDRQTGPRR